MKSQNLHTLVSSDHQHHLCEKASSCTTKHCCTPPPRDHAPHVLEQQHLDVSVAFGSAQCDAPGPSLGRPGPARPGPARRWLTMSVIVIPRVRIDANAVWPGVSTNVT